MTPPNPVATPFPMRTILACVLTAILCTAATATAASLVTGKQVKNNTLTGRDIKNGSIRKSDLAPSARAAQGPQGAQGLQGPQGPQGVPGPSGVTPTPQTVEDPTIISANRTSDLWATCPANTRIVGGGYRLEETYGGLAENSDVSILRNQPDTDRSWRVTVRNTDATRYMAVITAVCL